MVSSIVLVYLYIFIYILYIGLVVLMLKNENSIFAAAAPGAAAPASLRSAAAMLRDIGSASALLAVEDLRAYWLGIMADKRASYRDRLAASRLYADSIGAFAPETATAGTSGAVRWLEAEVVSAEPGAGSGPGSGGAV